MREGLGISSTSVESGVAKKVVVQPPEASLPKGGTIETIPSRSNANVSTWQSMEVRPTARGAWMCPTALRGSTGCQH